MTASPGRGIGFDGMQAHSADEIPFDDRDTQSASGERAGAMLARRATTQHNHVVVGRTAHLRAPLAEAQVGSSVPCCSASM